MPEKVKELKILLDQWRKNVKADIMQPNPDYRPDANPADFNTRKMRIKMEGTFL